MICVAKQEETYFVNSDLYFETIHTHCYRFPP